MLDMDLMHVIDNKLFRFDFCLNQFTFQFEIWFFQTIYIVIFQSNEVQGSYHMEKEGFIRSITNIESNGLKIEMIITDRYLQIQKHVKREHAQRNT